MNQLQTVTSNNLLNQLVEALRCLPGVGPKTAQRMAFYLLEKKREIGLNLATTLEQAMHKIAHCKICRNFSETELCAICANPRRNAELLCIVESPADVNAIEQTGAYRGHYFILMGRLSPLDGIGPNELGLDQLTKYLTEKNFQEVILATNNTVEGEATAHYLTGLIKPFNIPITRIAHGVPCGGELEFVDSNTLVRALLERR